MEVESILHEVPQFIVTLPLYPVHGKLPEDHQEEKVTSINDNSFKKLSVIMIDDDMMQLNYTQQMLNKQGIVSVCCSHVDQLFDELRNNHFDLLLTDIQMPAINGFDLLSLLRSSNIGQSKDIPVIALTARSDMEENQFIATGFICCLHKLFTVADFFILLNTVDAQTKKIQIINDIQLSEDINKNKFDFSVLLVFSDNDKDEEIVILTTFIKEIQTDIQIIEEALNENNITIITAKAHKLLPLFTLLKAIDVTETLLWIEQYDKDMVTEELTYRTNALITNLYNSVEEAQKYLNFY